VDGSRKQSLRHHTRRGTAVALLPRRGWSEGWSVGEHREEPEPGSEEVGTRVAISKGTGPSVVTQNETARPASAMANTTRTVRTARLRRGPFSGG
jgi:hypothetical protein